MNHNQLLTRRRFHQSFIAAASSLTAGAACAEAMGHPLPVRLSISAAENRRLASKVGEAARDLSRSLAGRLLLPVEASMVVDPRSERRAILHVLVVVDGEIRGCFSSYPPALAQPVSQGSIGKPLGLVAMLPADPGLLASGALWFAQPIGMHEADGSRGGGFITAAEAIARSRNLPTAWALHRSGPEARLRSRLASAGVRLPQGYRPSIALSFGHVEWSPLQVVDLFSVLGGHPAVGLARGAVPSKLTGWAKSALDKSALPATYIRALLAGPVTHERGTLRHLKPAIGALHPIAKSGTAINAAGQDIAKVFAASFSPRPGHLATVYTALASPRPSLPLGDALATSALASLHLAAINFSKELLK